MMEITVSNLRSNQYRHIHFKQRFIQLMRRTLDWAAFAAFLFHWESVAVVAGRNQPSSSPLSVVSQVSPAGSFLYLKRQRLGTRYMTRYTSAIIDLGKTEEKGRRPNVWGGVKVRWCSPALPLLCPSCCCPCTLSARSPAARVAFPKNSDRQRYHMIQLFANKLAINDHYQFLKEFHLDVFRPKKNC